MNTNVETATMTTASVINPEIEAVTPEAAAAPAKSKTTQNLITAAVVTGGIAGGMIIGHEATKYTISRERFSELLSEIQEVLYGESCKAVPDAYRIALVHEAAALCATASKQVPLRNNRASDSEFHRNAAVICENLINGHTMRNGTFAGLQSVKDNLKALATYHHGAMTRIDGEICAEPALPQKLMMNFKRMIRQPMTARKIRKEYTTNTKASEKTEDDVTV